MTKQATPYGTARQRAVILAAALLTAAGCRTTDDITADRLNNDLSATLTHLMGVTVHLTCKKAAGVGPQYGAGKDWKCTTSDGFVYALTARPNGCYTASSTATPPPLTGPADLRPRSLLSAVDGCLAA